MKGKMNMYIITNVTSAGEYTPSKAETFDEAVNFMVETTIENYLAGVGDVAEFAEMSGLSEGFSYKELEEKGLTIEFLRWAQKVGGLNFFINEDIAYSRVTYDDDSFNLMHVYDVDKLLNLTDVREVEENMGEDDDEG